MGYYRGGSDSESGEERVGNVDQEATEADGSQGVRVLQPTYQQGVDEEHHHDK